MSGGPVGRGGDRPHHGRDISGAVDLHRLHGLVADHPILRTRLADLFIRPATVSAGGVRWPTTVLR